MPWCMAEDEEASLKVGWQPYHVQKGYDLNQNTLTAASALLWGNNLAPGNVQSKENHGAHGLGSG